MQNQAERAFNLHAQNISLTYPQCPVHPDVAGPLIVAQARKLAAIKDGANEDVQVFVVQEHHQEVDTEGAQGLHLHAFVRFSKKVHSRNARAFDLEVRGGREAPEAQTYHPNVQGTKNVQAWVEYLYKEGGPSFVHPSTFDPKSLCGPGQRPGKADTIAKRIRDEGASYNDIVASDPGFAMMHSKMIKSFVADQKATSSQVDLARFQHFLSWEPNALYWIGKYVSPPGQTPKVTTKDVWDAFKRSFSMGAPIPNDPLEGVSCAEQLYLYGPTGIGKSFFAAALMKMMNCFLLPTEDWQDNYRPGLHKLAVVDEFHSGSMTLNWLNRHVTPYPTIFKGKGTAAGDIHKDPTLAWIFISNHPLKQTPEGVYPNCSPAEFGAAARRFYLGNEGGVPVNQQIMHELTQTLRMCLLSFMERQEVRNAVANGLSLTINQPGSPAIFAPNSQPELEMVTNVIQPRRNEPPHPAPVTID